MYTSDSEIETETTVVGTLIVEVMVVRLPEIDVVYVETTVVGI